MRFLPSLGLSTLLNDLITFLQILKSKESEIDNLASQIFALETEKNKFQAEIEKSLVQCENKIKELMMTNQVSASKVVEAEKALNEMR